MENEIIFYVKVIVAIVLGWKLGVLERKVEELINALGDQQRKINPH